MQKKHKILITGGAGFIGSHLTERLLNEGREVVIIDDFNDFYEPKFKLENIAGFKNEKNFRLHRGDVINNNFLKAVFKQELISTIIHLAARAGVRVSIQNPLLYERVNIYGTLNLLEKAREYNIKNFIFASSSSVYGKQEKIPFLENDQVNTPVSPYGVTKRACELFLYTYHHLFNMNCICLRFFTVYGERGRPDMAPYLFIENIFKRKEVKRFGDGNSKRDYTYVGDIVDGIVRCIDKNFGYEIINLGNNNPVSLNDFISILEKTIGLKVKIKNTLKQAGDVEITYADITKAKKLLSWQPKTTLEQGLKKFVDWYKEHRFKQE